MGPYANERRESKILAKLTVNRHKQTQEADELSPRKQTLLLSHPLSSAVSIQLNKAIDLPAVPRRR